MTLRSLLCTAAVGTFVLTSAASAGSSNCCVPNGTPGCDDATCQAAVCAADPFCCDVEWDALCVDATDTLCPGLCGSGGGDSDCCFANGTPGCDDAVCETDVCSIIPTCCTVAWDADCVEAALLFCEELCSGSGGDCPASDHDCFSTGGPGCTDTECCSLVCAADPFCCETAWDGLCVDGALTLCDPPTGEIICPDGASDEGEVCGTDTNDGCNLDTPSFGSISCGETICGTGWADAETRDTDWYEITLTAETEVTFSGTAAFPLVIGIVDTGGVADCSLATALNPFATAAQFSTASFTTCLPAGTYWFFAAPSVFAGFPCGGENNDYVITLECSAECEVVISECPDADASLTQSNDPIATAGQVACAAANITTLNQFARSFNLATGQTAGEDFLLTCVDFGVTNSGSAVPGTVNVYIDTNGGAPQNPLIDLDIIGSASLTIENSGVINRAVVFDPPICVPANSVLVIELEIEASTDGFAVIAGNPAGESAPTYIRSEACAITNFVSYASIGFPDNNWSLTLNGDIGCDDPGTPCPWDLDGDGSVGGADLGELLNQWGACPGCSADFNDDGSVDGADLGALLNAWGACP